MSVMQSTWEPRDLPVLRAFVEYLEERGYPGSVDGKQLAAQLGLPPQQVTLAVEALRPTYLQAEVLSHPDGDAYLLHRITDEGRRAAGQWPTPENIVDRLVQGLLDAAEQEPDEQKRSRLRSIAEGLRGFARDVAVGVISNAATAPLK